MTQRMIMQNVLEIIELEPKGVAAQTAAACFDAWADFANAILDNLRERGQARGENTTEYCAFVRAEALSWGFELDADGYVKSGIPK